VPSTTFLEIPLEEQAQQRAIRRRTRYGSLLAFHILLLCAAGQNPTDIAVFLLCSRSSIYRIVQAYRTGAAVYGSTPIAGPRWPYRQVS
jgi:hypothetical protein